MEGSLIVKVILLHVDITVDRTDLTHNELIELFPPLPRGGDIKDHHTSIRMHLLTEVTTVYPFITLYWHANVSR